MDGAPIEATEAPTVWDALNDAQTIPSNNIYSSVTQKLRKEKGQSLDAFMVTFMHSIEQRYGFVLYLFSLSLECGFML